MNCWEVLRALSTKGNRDKDWIISSQANIDLLEGSTTMIEITSVEAKWPRSAPHPQG